MMCLGVSGSCAYSLHLFCQLMAKMLKALPVQIDPGIVGEKDRCVTAFGVNRTLWTEPESSSLGTLLFFEKECISKITKVRLCLIDLQAKEFTIIYKSRRRHTFTRSLKSLCSVAQKPALWSLA